MAEVKQGTVIITCGQDPPQPVRLNLGEDNMVIQKEELVYSQPYMQETATLVRERRVVVKREKIGGLGLSVKGGAEHNLPILVSRIFKDQAADKTGQLFVGDAILRVNGLSVERSSHDEAVAALKTAGDEVTLLVKYFRPASLFLSRNKRSYPGEGEVSEEHSGNYSETKLEKQWTDMTTIPLLFSHVTRYIPGTDRMRPSSFEVCGLDGTSTGVVHCEDGQALHDWMRCIHHNISMLNNQWITMSNKLLVPSMQIGFMSWVCERMDPSRHWQRWKPQFLALKGPDIFFFDTPPLKMRDWVRCQNTEKIYESVFRVLKDSELVDNRQHCFMIQTGTGDTHYLSAETREDLLNFEKAWHRSNYVAVSNLVSKTFGCTWRGRISGLTLDMNVGFSLYDSESKCYMWSYKFSQLKGSSDDGRTRLKLHFQDENAKSIETREIDCTNLQTLLYSMHAFLSAKLASVDPSFLQFC